MLHVYSPKKFWISKTWCNQSYFTSFEIQIPTGLRESWVWQLENPQNQNPIAHQCFFSLGYPIFFLTIAIGKCDTAGILVKLIWEAQDFKIWIFIRSWDNHIW